MAKKKSRVSFHLPLHSGKAQGGKLGPRTRVPEDTATRGTGREARMAGSVNKVILVGNLGRDPEVRTFPSGGKVVSLRVATSENWRDKQSGERKERTEWHSVSIYNENLGRIAEQYLRKGSKVYLEGQLETRKWQDQSSGQDRYSTEIALRFNATMTLLDGRGEGGGGYEQDRAGGGGSFERETRSPASQIDDEIPF